MDRPLRIAAFAASKRRGSLNRRLLARTVAALEAVTSDIEVDVIDLRSVALPLYDPDMEERDGVPDAAVALHARIAAADAVLVAVPEYNGGYPALFKNVIDWVTRVEMFAFLPRYLGVLAATPGKGGGARGIADVQALFANMFLTVHDDGFALPFADKAMAGDGWTDEEAEQRLRSWVDAFALAATEHADEQAAEAA